MRELDNPPHPPKHVNEKIIGLHEKDFRIMIVKMIQDFGKKLEAKIDKLEEILNEEIEDLKIKKAEIQNSITKNKKLF